MGRKPINNQPMSPAERVKSHRLKKKAEGSTQLSMNFSKNLLEKIDELVEFFELRNRAVLMEQLLNEPLLEAIEVMESAKTVSIPDMTEEERKTIKHIKRTIWKAICLGDPDIKELVHNTLQKHVGEKDVR